jgi:hypothetical protein
MAVPSAKPVGFSSQLNRMAIDLTTSPESHRGKGSRGLLLSYNDLSAPLHGPGPLALWPAAP